MSRGDSWNGVRRSRYKSDPASNPLVGQVARLQAKLDARDERIRELEGLLQVARECITPGKPEDPLYQISWAACVIRRIDAALQSTPLAAWNHD